MTAMMHSTDSDKNTSGVYDEAVLYYSVSSELLILYAPIFADKTTSTWMHAIFHLSSNRQPPLHNGPVASDVVDLASLTCSGRAGSD